MSEGQSNKSASLGVAANISKWLARGGRVAAFGGPMGWVLGGGVGVIIFFIFIPVLIVVVIALGLSGAASLSPAPVEAAPNPGTGTGLLDDVWCVPIKTLPDGSCSKNLELLFEAAADWSKMPAGILAALISKECNGVYTLSDAQITQYSQEGAQVPHTICADSGKGAHGPAQFLLTTFRQNGKYHQAYNHANGTSRTTNVHNLADAVYASAWYLKCLQITYTNPIPVYTTACNSADLSAVPFNVVEGNDEKLAAEDVYPFLAAYAGFRKDGDVDVQGCIDQGYCEDIYNWYEDISDTSAVPGAPWGWSVSGTMTQGPYDEANITHGDWSAIDIAHIAAQPVYATHDGNVIKYPDSGDGYGNYVQVFSATYITKYAHLEAFSSCLDALPNNTMIKAGTYLGTTGWTGFVEPKGPGGRHLHYHIFDDAGFDITLEEFNSLVPDTYTYGKSVVVNYSGDKCILGP